MIGLVLEGGGAKGAFHCGAVKALYDYGYKFDGVAGTSIGAINGALIAQDCGYEKMYDVWTSVTAEDITHFDNIEVGKLFNREFSKKTVSYWGKQVLKVVSNLGVPTDKVSEYLHKIIDEDKLRSSPMDFGIVTYCLSNREPLELFKEDIPVGELHNFILASAYFPAFRLGRMNGKYYIDGGVYDNLPLNALPEQKNYDEIYAIRTMSRMPHKEIKRSDVVVHYICPSEDLGNTININSRAINYKIKLGYYDALRFIKGYKGFRYYVNGDADIFDRIFYSLNDSTKEKICNLFRIKEETFITELSEKLKPKTSEETAIPNIDSFFSFFEDIAAFYGVEKFSIYTQEEFINQIIKKSVSTDTDLLLNGFGKFTALAKKLALYQLLIPYITEIKNG